MNSENRDARERAVRTLLWGLLVDVGTAVVLVLLTATKTIEWTSTYWLGLASLTAKSVIQALVAFAGRKLLVPVSAQSDPPRDPY